MVEPEQRDRELDADFPDLGSLCLLLPVLAARTFSLLTFRFCHNPACFTRGKRPGIIANIFVSTAGLPNFGYAVRLSEHNLPLLRGNRMFFGSEGIQSRIRQPNQVPRGKPLALKSR